MSRDPQILRQLQGALGLAVVLVASATTAAQHPFIPPPPPPPPVFVPPPNPQQMNQGMMHAAQAHATAQQASNHHMQQHWHNQRVMESARQFQNSDWNRLSSAGAAARGNANAWQGQGAGVWQPGERFRSDNLAVAYQRLSAVDYRSLTPVERGQYKAACRKFRLAAKYGYQYR